MSDVDLRALVRSVLAETLAARRPADGAAPPAASAGAETVRIDGDADLAAFVARLLRLAEDPQAARALREGRHRFTLARPDSRPSAPPAAPASPGSGAPVVLEGLVTEARIAGLRGAAAVRLAPGAILTPLARDRIRALGLAIEGRR